MINIKELRIDNWVRIMEPDKYAGAVGKIQALSSLEGSYFTINVNDPNFGYLHTDVFCEDLEPIPLTAEILEKFGFEYINDEYGAYYLNRVELREREPYNGLFEVEASICGKSVFVRYVHQLQNILIDLGIDKEIIL